MENFNTHEAVKSLLAAQKKGKEHFVEEVVNQLQQSRKNDLSRLATGADLKLLRKDLEMVQLELTKKIDDDHAVLQKNIDAVHTNLQQNISSLEIRIEQTANSNLRWTMSTMIAGFGILAALKFFG